MNTVYEPPKTDVRTEMETFDPPLLSAKGRMGRVRYIAHGIWLSLVIYAAFAAVGFAISAAVSETVGALVIGSSVIALIVVQFILTIKRCHDFNASGWWSVLSIVPLVVLVFWLIPGTKGPNRFGAPPSRNTLPIILGALILPFIFLAGILAAIAVPAYQDYSQRAQVGEAFAATAGTKTTIAEFRQNSGDWPTEVDLEALGIGGMLDAAYSTHTVEAGTGTITVTMKGTPAVGPDIASGQITFRPEIGETFRFVCTSRDISQKFLPRSCDGVPGPSY